MQEHEVLSCDFISQTMDGTTLYKISDIGGDNLLVSSSEITEVSPQIIKRRLPMTMYDYVVQRHSAGRMLVARAYDDDEIHIVVDGRASKVAAPLTLSSVLGGLALVYADHVIVVRPVDGF